MLIFTNSEDEIHTHNYMYLNDDEIHIPLTIKHKRFPHITLLNPTQDFIIS